MGPLDDTICALSTPPGTGAIAIVRVSGPEAFAMVHALGGPDLNAVRDRKAELVKLADEEGPIDEAVITALAASPPKAMRWSTNGSSPQDRDLGSSLVKQLPAAAVCRLEE